MVGLAQDVLDKGNIMITEKKLYHSILIINPKAEFSFWENDGRQNDWVDHNQTYSFVDIWCIAWKNSNESQCPTLEEINAVTDQQVEEQIAEMRLAYYVERYSTSLGVIANYQTAKLANPALTFEAYVQYLLTLSDDLQI